MKEVASGTHTCKGDLYYRVSYRNKIWGCDWICVVQDRVRCEHQNVPLCSIKGWGMSCPARRILIAQADVVSVGSVKVSLAKDLIQFRLGLLVQELYQWLTF
jgi:hypothetical protein